MNLEELGFKRKQEWDYRVGKKKTREVYIKKYVSFSVKAFKLGNGISFGKLIKTENPLCEKYAFAIDIEVFNKTIESWT